MIRREIHWLSEEVFEPTNFVTVLNPWEYGFEHKRTGLIVWHYGELWRRRRWLPWMFSARIALNPEEQKLLSEAHDLLKESFNERRKQNAIEKSAPTLSKAFVQSDADKKLIESKLEENVND